MSALEIKQDVEGYSEMNDDAFARRFYADRAELEALGISLKVEKPPEGYFEAELYTLPPENFYLPPIEFEDGELAALQTSLALLDGRFAYAEPLRLALQQLSWGRPSPLGAPEQRSVAVAVTASAGGRELSQRLAKVETAISRRKTIEFSYYSIERDEVSQAQGRPVPPALPGRSVLPRRATRTSARTCACSGSRGSGRRSPTRPRPSTTSPRPTTSIPGATRTAPTGSSAIPTGTADVWISERIAWLIERDFGRYGTIGEGRSKSGNAVAGRLAPRARPGRRLHDRVRAAAPADRLGARPGRERARLLDPPEVVDEAAERLAHDRRAPRGRAGLRRRAGRGSAPASPTTARNGSGRRRQRRTATRRSGPSASRGWSRWRAS